MKNKNQANSHYFLLLVLLTAIFIFGPKFALAQAVESVDGDQDGLSDFDEVYIYHTDLDIPDTDGDTYLDGEEAASGYSPRHADKLKLVDVDSDNDGLNDGWELSLGTDLLNPDTDNDTYLDGEEVMAGYNPLSGQPEKAGKLIEVNLVEQKLAYYFNNIKLEEFAISGGVSSMPTPTGNFTVLDKVASKNYGGSGFSFYYPDTKWNLHFTTGKWRYYIHGAYWHNNFGRPMSHGCVNVAYENMERLYNWAQVGTTVEIF